MLQFSKILESRDEWKTKAVQRANKIREYRKTIKRNHEQLEILKKRVLELEQIADDSKKKQVTTTTGNVVNVMQTQITQTLCLLIVINAVVSFRSVPKIITLFNTQMFSGLSWVPHFTSVINWALRLGLGLLEQIKPSFSPWLAIIDHSIDIGVKKALVVLRVNMAALSQRGSAIRLEDCECIGLKISTHINGESVAKDLEEIFNKAGMPQAIIKDGDYTLNKGVRIWQEKQGADVSVIEDIGHSMAKALKDEYEKTDSFKSFIDMLTQCANRLRQTDLAFLIPPKLRSKGRFQSVSTLGKWAEKILPIFAVSGRAKNGSLLDRLRTIMPGFTKKKQFIKIFANTVQIVAKVMENLKSKGLNQESYEYCCKLSETLPKKSKIKGHLTNWLIKHIKIQKKLADLPLLVSSDIIESLFGNFKHIIERSPQADMNRTTLLIPALCGTLNQTKITQVLNQVRHKELKIWEKANIPYTVRKKRRAFFDNINIQKAGKT